MDLDASQLRPGGRYRLCIDMDGQGTLGAGDTGLDVYLSTAQLSEPLTILPSQQQIVGPFLCDVCSTASQAYLGVECPGHVTGSDESLKRLKTGIQMGYTPGDTEPQEPWQPLKGLKELLRT